MNILCNVCSEYLTNEDDLVITVCGHCFHRKCISDWIRNSPTCPTCRRSQLSTSSLIKVYAETDQARLNDLHSELLKSNEKLTKELEELKVKSIKQASEINELTMKCRDANDKLKKVERDKQLADMAVTGLKMIKDESTKEILKLNTQLNTLKLDLLAEKELRRIHQTSLHKFDPKNENYDVKSLSVDEPTTSQSSNYQITPFWQLSSEAAAKNEATEKEHPYIVPSKIQRANEKCKFGSFINQKRAFPLKRSNSREETVQASSFNPLVNDESARNSDSNQSKVPVTFNFTANSSLSSLFRFGTSEPSSSNAQPSSSNQNTHPTFKSYRDNNKDIGSPRPSER